MLCIPHEVLNMVDAKDMQPFGLEGTLAGPNDKVETVIEVTKDDTNSDTTLQLTTSISIGGFVPEADVSEKFLKNVQRLAVAGELKDLGSEQITIGQHEICDDDATDLEHYVFQIGGGDWCVKSLFSNFKRNEKKSKKPPLVERFVGTHEIIINALHSAVKGKEIIDLGLESVEIVHLRILDSHFSDIDEDIRPRAEPFSDIIGMENNISKLKAAIKITNMTEQKRKELDLQPVQAFLFHGKSGTGKTEVARELAVELNADIEEINLGDVSGIYVGQWAANLEEKFDDAINADERVLLFFDEADGSLNPSNPDSRSNVNSVLKKQLERIQDHPHVFVVFACNDTSTLDKNAFAAKRVPEMLEFLPPSANDLTAYLGSRLLLSNITCPNDPTDLFEASEVAAEPYDFKLLGKLMDGMTIGEVKSAYELARRNEFTRSGDEGGITLSQSMLVSALRDIKSRQNRF
jgi:hypothetical protein